ncbi:AMP-binding protein [Candidatus Sulfidibacterium hydrothermale]|uniref:AMP-binding protein n=1 Tax=Candidatus Sulfidibacterium hydrothermale TaxID=2875962 RepID=UPI001F0AAED8|nr:AMP-binding protein [Candidatus Sulfidibacterium hydrothermale]UBM61644.1 AMP-binding protein [Candidatus Sulfidibacterium hydrothermale]
MEKKDWFGFYGDVPHSLHYPEGSLYQLLKKSIDEHPHAVAYDFLDKTATYTELGKQIDALACQFHKAGFRRGDTMSIIMPTSPQGILAFYAVNKLGGVAAFIHPLSTEEELKHYLTLSQSRFALTLDIFYEKIAHIKNEVPLEKLFVTHISDYMPPVKKLAYRLITLPKRVKTDKTWTLWLEKTAAACEKPVSTANMESDALAVILFSGGTTGVPKGVMLTNKNIVSEGMMVAAWGKLDESDTILAILPIFHGFGLSVCVNAALLAGAKTVLIPKFTVKDVARLIKKKKPTFLIGVPTLFKALLDEKSFRNSDLSFLKMSFSGADTLPRNLKEAFDETVRKNGGKSVLLEGYGLTEAVTAIMALPAHEYREGSIGLPFPDMDVKIVDPESYQEMPHGEIGEIVIHGPAVMKGYLNNPEETAATLKVHDDGEIWLHTGDLGYRDADGFFYFKQRLKRMIKSSGMNVYPSEVENVICQHEDVKFACVIGVEDAHQMTRIKAFVELHHPEVAGREKEEEIIAFVRKRLIKWSCPREIEFMEKLPLTKIGKVDFRKLEEIEYAKQKGH